MDMARISVGDNFVSFELIDGWEFDSQGVTEGQSYEVYTTDKPLSDEEIAAIAASDGVRLFEA